jgi:hypothetical protein
MKRLTLAAAPVLHEPRLKHVRILIDTRVLAKAIRRVRLSFLLGISRAAD